eukprot:PITA_29002
MAFYGLRLEYALEGSSNYIAQKDRMEAVLEDNGLKEFIDQEIPKPTSTNAQELGEWKKCVAKVRWIILEGVQDHIVSSLHGKDTPFSMWKTLNDLYQNSSDQRKLVLKDKLRRIKMEKGDTISTYLNKLTTYRYELGSVEISTVDDDMVSLALLGLPKIWNSYQYSVNGREKLLDWERLCGASFHMTSDKNLFSALMENDLKMHIEMGDDGRYSVLGVGTVAFEREHGCPLTLIDVIYVPGLKKNLVSITMLEEKGYDVVFSKGKVFLRRIAMGQTKRIGILMKNLYKLEVDDCAALSMKGELVKSQDIGELWSRWLGHLHHGALKIMLQISTRLPKGKLEQVDICKGCTLGKYTKYSFHNRDSRAEAILERVHTDLCGPFSMASTMRQRYYVNFIDDYSHKC